MAGEQHRLSDNACPLWESSFFNLYVIGYFILFFTFFLDRCSTECYNQFV